MERLRRSSRLASKRARNQQTRVERHHIAVAPTEPDRRSIMNQALSGDCLRLTEIAAMGKNSDDCEGEIASSFYPPLVTVGDYRVARKYATLLRNIFTKYGDIAKNRTFKAATSCSIFLEMVCAIFLRLEGSNILAITLVDLKKMMDELEGLKEFGLDVEWLSKKLDEIHEAKRKLSESSSIKQEIARSKEAIEKMELKISVDEMILTTKQDEVEILKAKLGRFVEDIVILKEKISSSKANLAALKVKDEEIKASGLDTRKKVNHFIRKSLVDGLL